MKIALGMSGGVDSSVCAALLKQAGHDVTGVFLECWRGPGCRAEEDRQDALKVALDLEIPFTVLDFKDAYKQRVVDVYLRDLALGLTPNPDVWCNTEIKFGLFYDWAMQEGYDAIATGHYAQVKAGEGEGGQKGDEGLTSRGEVGDGLTSRGELALSLHSGADSHKDQTYFLYRTRQDQLAHVLFPIGHLTKPEVRQLAEEFKLPTASKPDSQGICFIGDIDVRGFVRDHLGTKPGNVLDVEGNVIGSHDGVWFFTVGQRHGFRLDSKVRTVQKTWKHVIPPLYVIAKDAEANTITVGYGADTLTSQITVADTVWRRLPHTEELSELRVRVRHGGALLEVSKIEDVPSDIESTEAATVKLTLQQPQRGLAPGQAAVFYGAGEQPICWGGGVIVSAQ